MKTSTILQLILLSPLVSFASTLSHVVDYIKSVVAGVEEETSSEVQFAQKNNDLLDIYWINLDRSTHRRDIMNTVYDFYGLRNSSHRFTALTPAEIGIPKGLESARQCNYLKENETLTELGRVRSVKNHSKRPKIPLTSHCARTSLNRNVLATTLSHLLTIFQAVHHHKSKKYALIMEDDFQPAMEIDFETLIQSAPEDFAILQLVSGHSESVQENWNYYREKGLTWRPSGDSETNWCAGAYIVHKDRLRPIILFSTCTMVIVTSPVCPCF
jgi:hypothetical protein